MLSSGVYFSLDLKTVEETKLTARQILFIRKHE